MEQTTQQIETHIRDTRDNLGSNLQELEQKVKSATDWKQHFQTKPMTMLGIAFGGGVLLATMMGGRRKNGKERSAFSGTASETMRGGNGRPKALETWDNIKGALIGVAATRFTDFVSDMVPGFQEQFRRVDDKTKAIQTTGQ